MMASRPACPLSCPTQADLDALVLAGIPVLALARRQPMRIGRGHEAPDGLFEPDPAGEPWYAFEVANTGDIGFWEKTSGEIATWPARAFALGEEIIDHAAT